MASVPFKNDSNSTFFDETTKYTTTKNDVIDSNGRFKKNVQKRCFALGEVMNEFFYAKQFKEHVKSNQFRQNQRNITTSTSAEKRREHLQTEFLKRESEHKHRPHRNEINKMQIQNSNISEESVFQRYRGDNQQSFASRYSSHMLNDNQMKLLFKMNSFNRSKKSSASSQLYPHKFPLYQQINDKEKGFQKNVDSVKMNSNYPHFKIFTKSCYGLAGFICAKDITGQEKNYVKLIML